MSWIDNVENIIFTIITGDGAEWRPKWRNAVKDVEYNASVFEFINISGSLVLRQQPKGKRFDLEFYFDGVNAVINGNNFELSARDKRAWKILHPFYGNFNCQPLSLKQDNSALNVSKFTVPVIETITDSYPQFTKIYTDEIIDSITETNETQAQTYNNSGEFDKITLAQDVAQLDTVFSKIIKTGDELKSFKTLVSNAYIEIINTTGTGLSVMRAMLALINYPATIAQTVNSRFVALKEAFDAIIDSFSGNKNQFETIGGGIITGMFAASTINIENDYEIRANIIDQQNKIIDVYNTYMSFIDSLQTDRADSNDSYAPCFNCINKLSSLLGLTVANLFEIAFGAKQEREYVLDKDNNVITLAHKFYGLDDQDQNIDLFIRTNNIGLNELLNIRKGRKIIYYV